MIDCFHSLCNEQMKAVSDHGWIEHYGPTNENLASILAANSNDSRIRRLTNRIPAAQVASVSIDSTSVGWAQIGRETMEQEDRGKS